MAIKSILVRLSVGGERNLTEVIEWKHCEDLLVIRCSKKHFVYPLAQVQEMVVTLE